jgi:starch synthase (maltosyl-transferring)
VTVRNSSTGAPAVAGNRRIEIERLLPAVDGGRYPIKRAVGDAVEVEAHIYSDGHDAIAGRLLWRKQGASAWGQAPLRLRWNDEWLASFTVEEVGTYEYTVEAWIDHYRGWARDLAARINAGQDIRIDLRIGMKLLREAAGQARGTDGKRLLAVAEQLESGKGERAAVATALSPALVDLASSYARPEQTARLKPPLRVTVDRPRAAAGAWYEMFPR